MSGANSAISTSATIIVRPITAERWRKKARIVCRQRLSGGRVRVRDAGPVAVVIAISVCSLKSNAWIEERVGKVDQQIDGDIAEGNHQGEALDDRIIARRDRLIQHPADAGQTKDRLGQHRAAEDPAKL